MVGLLADSNSDFSTYSAAFASALVGAQGAIEGAKKGKSNPAFRSKYADLGACWDACREALQSNGLAVLQFTTRAKDGHAGLKTRIVYGPTGEFMEDITEIPLKDPTNPQAYGSAITYARRYALCALMGICPEDDDGNAAAAAPKAQANYPSARDVSVVPDRWEAEFAKCKTRDEMKTMYSRLKSSDLSPDVKTPILAVWAKKILEQK